MSESKPEDDRGPTMSFDFDLLLTQLEQLGSSSAALDGVPDDIREKLSRAARTVSVKLETPAETVARLMLCQPIEGACVRVATDMKLFTALASEGPEPKTVDQLAKATVAEPALVSRLLRCLSANNAVIETADGYLPNQSFSLLADPAMAEAYGPCEAFLNKIYESMPGFLADTKYHEPLSAVETVIQRAYSMPQRPGMEIIASDTKAVKAFSVLMSTWQDGFTQFHSLYPVEERLISAFDASKSDAVFVDVGGGFGQKSIALKQAFPQLPGKLVVQDLPHVIALAPRPDLALAVDLTEHDFFTEQPVKGAKAYYLRQTLHNWTDSDVVRILTRLADAMTPGYSTLIVHEIIIPERSAGRWAATQDFEMLAMFAARERTQTQWKELCEASGLTVANIYLDTNPAGEGLIEATL